MNGLLTPESVIFTTIRMATESKRSGPNSVEKNG